MRLHLFADSAIARSFTVAADSLVTFACSSPAVVVDHIHEAAKGADVKWVRSQLKDNPIRMETCGPRIAQLTSNASHGKSRTKLILNSGSL